MIYFIMSFKCVHKIVCVMCITVVYTAQTYDFMRAKRLPSNTGPPNNYSTINKDPSNDHGNAGHWVPTDSRDYTQLSEQWDLSSNREPTTPQGHWSPPDNQGSTGFPGYWEPPNNRDPPGPPGHWGPPDNPGPPEPMRHWGSSENRGGPGASRYWGPPGHQGPPEPPRHWRPPDAQDPPEPPGYWDPSYNRGPPGPPPRWHLPDDHGPRPPGVWGPSYNLNAPGSPRRWHRPDSHGPSGPPGFWGPSFNQNHPRPHWHPPYNRGRPKFWGASYNRHPPRPPPHWYPPSNGYYPRPGPPGRWGQVYSRGPPNYRAPFFHRRPPDNWIPPVNRNPPSQWGLPAADNQDSPKHRGHPRHSSPTTFRRASTEQVSHENWSTTDSKGHSENNDLSSKQDNTANNWNLPRNKNSQSESYLPYTKENMDAEISINFRNSPVEPTVDMNLTNTNFNDDTGTPGMFLYAPYLFQAVPVTPEV